MRRIRNIYSSPVDALVALTKRLSTLENRYQMSSEEFYDRFTKGLLEDTVDFVEWANNYRHFLDLYGKSRLDFVQ